MRTQPRIFQGAHWFAGRFGTMAHGWAGLLSLCLGLLLGVACAPCPPPAQTARSMPQGGVWQGVYQGPGYIYLRILSDGDVARGQWRAQGSQRGDLWGSIHGNRLDYSWREESLNPANKSVRYGTGYFIYRISGAQHEIVGTATTWPATKSLRFARKRLDVPFDAPEAAFLERNAGNGDEDDGSACPGCSGDDADAPE